MMANVSCAAANSLSAQLPANQVVSWRSAYWALVGLALNTFVQSPGTVLAFPEQSGRSLRTSPIICIVDTILILFKYLAFRRLGMNHVDTARFIIRKRFSERELQDTAGRPERTWFFKTVILFGALSQAIKLLGMRGIIATQVIGMVYFVSYAAIEVLLLSIGPDWSGNPMSVSPDIEWFNERLRIWTERLQLMVIQLQRMAWTWIVLALWSNEVVEAAVGLGLSPSLRTRSQRTLHVTIFAGANLCLGLCVVFFLFCVLAFISSRCASIFSQDDRRNGEDIELRHTQSNSFMKRRLPLKILLFNLTTHGAHTAILNTYFNTWNIFYESIELAQLMIAWYVLLLAMLLHFLVFLAVARICKDDVKRKFLLDGSIREWASLHFAASNIVIGMIYYACLYDPKGTRKPPWTENLG